MKISGLLCVRLVFGLILIGHFLACSNKKLLPVATGNNGGPAIVPDPGDPVVNPCIDPLKASIELMLPPTFTVRVGGAVSYGVRASGCKGRYQLQREAEVPINFNAFTYFTKIYNAPGSVSETITVLALDEGGNVVDKISVNSNALTIVANDVPFFGCDVMGSPLVREVPYDSATGLPVSVPTFNFTILTTRNTQVMGVFAFPGIASLPPGISLPATSAQTHSLSVQVQGLGRQRVSFNVLDMDNSTPTDQLVQECTAEVTLIRVDLPVLPPPSPTASPSPSAIPTPVPPMAAATFNGLAASEFTLTMGPNATLSMLWVTRAIPSENGANCGVQYKEVDSTHLNDISQFTDRFPATSPYTFPLGTFAPGHHYKVKLVCYDNTDTDKLYPAQVGQYIYVNKCIGKVVAGSTACWYLGASGQSCTSVCSAYGGYHNDTQTFSGSAGTDGQCGAVMNKLGVSPSTIIAASAYAVGCTRVNNTSVVYRWKGDPTNAGSTLSGYQRACGCQL